MRTKNKPMPFRRKREGKTDYKQRLRLIASGKPRLVVRTSLKNVLAQIIDFHPDGDRVLASASALDLKRNFGWKANTRNIPAAYLTGLLVAKRATAKKLKEVILDIGLRSPIKGSVVFAVLKGAIDGGLSIPHSPDVIPPEKRIKGEHIKNSQFEEVKQKVLKA
ncbi:MAG TPA: 50S ribosomal protein L18 [Candidatus Nanoarchaeia archaeon]|nr:50S ribosomal protein L18 [Candidatus Nanoarchaeia archaeon]